MNAKNAVEITNVTKAFKIKTSPESQKPKPRFRIRKRSEENVVLDNVSLSIKKGEVVGVIGRNGSGKSTLLKLISNIMKPDSGKIEVSGTIASILELGMGFHQDMTGRENIYIKGAMYGFGKKEIDERIDDIIEYSNLGDYIDNPLRNYSSGMTGRLAFAIMIHVDADIFLVDEILSIGDVSFSAKAVQYFRNLAKSGKTVIFVSHNLSTIEEMCGRTIWIEGGKIREDGQSKIVCSHYKKEMIESFEITSELAEYGVLDAQYRLARMYLDGGKVGADHAIACEWMKRAAEGRHIQAQVEYADMLFDGVGTEQDVAAAVFYYQTAADRGSNDARAKIAMLMQEENDDRKETLNFFKGSAEKGDPLSEYRYADLLLKTAWNNDDRKNALDWFLKAGDGGHVESKYQAAMMYRDGVGAAADIDSCIRLFREAAEAGHYWAPMALAELFFAGTRTEKNDAEAFKWYLRSAEMGNPKSQYQAAVMYRDGVGVETNAEESKRWFKVFSDSSVVNHQLTAAEILKFAKPNDLRESEDMLIKASGLYNSTAMFRLGLLYKDRPNPNMASAVKWLTSSSEIGNVHAHLALGDIFSKGTGVEKDLFKAFGHYLAAALGGIAAAAYRVAMMSKDGVGTEKDADRYRMFLRIAVEGGNREAMLESEKDPSI